MLQQFLQGLAPFAGAIILGLFTAYIVRQILLLRRVVEPNEVHIVQARGTTKAYGKGQEDGNAYYDWPAWIPFIGVQTIPLPLSVFDESLAGYEAYDVGKVPFVVDVMAFYRISDPIMASERVAHMSELREQLRAILQGAARTILAKEEIEDIMLERSRYGQMFTNEVEVQLKQWGVSTVKTIELMDIRDGVDSQVVSNIMAKKESLIDRQSREEVANNKKEAQIAEINAQKERDVSEQEAILLVGQRTAEQTKQVGIANEQAQQDIKDQQAITATKDMAVKRVEDVKAAEIHKDVIIVQAEENKQNRIITAEADKQEKIVMAEGVKESTITTAEGTLESEKMEATAIQVKGEASAEAERLMQEAPQHAAILLAKEIGQNPEYQEYLVNIEEIARGKAVGIEQAEALQNADIKVIVQGGDDANSGLDSVMDIFSAKGGTSLGAAAEAFSQTPEGRRLMDKFIGTTDGVGEPS